MLLLDEPTEGLDAAAVPTCEQAMRAGADRLRMVASYDAGFIRRFEPGILAPA